MSQQARKAGAFALAASLVVAALVGLAYAGGVPGPASVGPASADQ